MTAVTTASSIEGYQIVAYKGTAHGAAVVMEPIPNPLQHLVAGPRVFASARPTGGNQ